MFTIVAYFFKNKSIIFCYTKTMKTRLLILLLCLIPLYACDKTPRPQNAAQRDMFVQADKNFNTMMLPLDKYFDRNGMPDEIQNFKNLKDNYNSDIKKALLLDNPAARDAALKTADDKYVPQINALQNQVKQRAANSYISDLEDKNAQARAQAGKIFGPQAEAEVKTAQDQMMNEIKSALTSPDPRSAYKRVENAGNNFQNNLGNIINKYAARQNTPPDIAAKVVEPYNSGGPTPVKRPVLKNNVPAGPTAPARQNNPLRPLPNPAALSGGNGISGGTASASTPRAAGSLPEFLNNYKSLPSETSDAGGLAGQDFLSKIQNDIKTVRAANQRPESSNPSQSGAASGGSGRPGSSGGGETMAYIPEDKLTEIAAQLDNTLKENYPKLESMYGKDAAERYKQINEKYKDLITAYGAKPQQVNTFTQGYTQLIKNYFAEDSKNYINTDYDYRTKKLGEWFDGLKGAMPGSADVLTAMQNDAVQKLSAIKEKGLQYEPVIDTDGKITGKPGSIITPSEQYDKETGAVLSDVVGKVTPIIDRQKEQEQKDYSYKVGKGLDDTSKPVVNDLGKFGLDIKNKYAALVNAANDDTKQKLLNAKTPEDRNKIQQDYIASLKDLQDMGYAEGSSSNRISMVNKSLDSNIKYLSDKGYTKEAGQVAALQTAYNQDAKNIQNAALNLPSGSRRLDSFNKGEEQLEQTYQEKLNDILQSVSGAQ